MTELLSKIILGRLDSSFDIGSFDSDELSLNRGLVQLHKGYDEAELEVLTIATVDQPKVIIGYVAFGTASLDAGLVPDHVGINSFAERIPVLQIMYLAIDKTYRGHGLGLLLFNQVVGRARHEGIAGVEVQAINHKVSNVYVSYGCKRLRNPLNLLYAVR